MSKTLHPPLARDSRHLARSGLSEDQCSLVTTRVRDLLYKARKKLGMDFPLPGIRFDLAGKAAGQYRCEPGVLGGRNHLLRFNPYLLYRHFSDGLETTVPHEVAHYVVAFRVGTRRVKPHGREWRQMMELFGATPEVTHRYDMAGVPVRRQRKWLYECACRRHELSTTRHRRVVGGTTTYRCTRCGGTLAAVCDNEAD